MHSKHCRRGRSSAQSFDAARPKAKVSKAQETDANTDETKNKSASLAHCTTAKCQQCKLIARVFRRRCLNEKSKPCSWNSHGSSENMPWLVSENFEHTTPWVNFTNSRPAKSKACWPYWSWLYHPSVHFWCYNLSGSNQCGLQYCCLFSFNVRPWVRFADHLDLDFAILLSVIISQSIIAKSKAISVSCHASGQE